MAPPRNVQQCQHKKLYVECSPAVAKTKYEQRSRETRLAAGTLSGRALQQPRYAMRRRAFDDAAAFPAPLVLPDDALATDPKYPPQSVRSWMMLNKDRLVSQERDTIYVVSPPRLSREAAAVMTGWERPDVPEIYAVPGLPEGISTPKTDDMCDYMAAFYHTVKVKRYDNECEWTLWPDEPEAGDPNTRNRIGLQVERQDGTREVFGIRHRPSIDGIAAQQLNLNDMLDALLSILPSDAYAVMMLVDHDLYEDEDDDFCCGRAYGGSRICVVSSFRYHPALDDFADIDQEHMWPASHCTSYIDSLCPAPPKPRSRKRAPASSSRARRAPPHPSIASSASTPLGAAAQAASPHLVPGPGPGRRRGHEGLWASRVARTASHELGHCFGMDHCVYLACVMQGTGSVAEDVRQPPDLCPVCLEKLSLTLAPNLVAAAAAAGSGGEKEELDVRRRCLRERFEALRRMCRRWEGVGMFVGWGAWIDRWLEMEDEAVPLPRVEIDLPGES